MALDFGKNGYENLFRQALAEGINLFCGAGFSVEATAESGNRLPVGETLLEELKLEFPSITSYTKLPRACTKLMQTDKGSFYSFLKKRFKVDNYLNTYDALLSINIKNVYTTNIDDLFYKIVENSKKAFYLNDRSIRGGEYIGVGEFEQQKSIDYYPLHGCIRTSDDFVFGATEVASAFSQKDTRQSWKSLAKDASQHSILFWGWNFEDSGPIEAMYGGDYHVNDNEKKWALLYNPNEETEDFLLSLNFNIIKGETKEMLQYLLDFSKEYECDNCDEHHIEDECDLQELARYVPPSRDTVGSYPLKSFFCDYTPRWYYVYAGEIPRLSYYRKIADWIAANKNVIITGIRGAGKTTLLMQLTVNIETHRLKHYMIAPTLETVEIYLRSLHNRRSMLFVDDCFRDTRALIRLFCANNVQVICCDRDFNFEQQYHKIKEYCFKLVDITEISQEDGQAVLNVIPKDLKRVNASTRRFIKDPTLPNLLITTLKNRHFEFMKSFYDNDVEAARVFLMVCYVHSCGVPCSFDMVYSFLGDDAYSWQDMLDIVQRAGQLIKECNNSTDYFGSYDLDFSLQNYYQCRSGNFARTIIESIAKEDNIFSDVLFDFVDFVPPFKICSYDKFKRFGYDADIACLAFKGLDDGKEYYEKCVLRDEGEYIYQQAAIYFSRIGELKEAFIWIDRARNLANYNRFSIDSTYAMIYFQANVGIDYSQCKKALDILNDCCTSDKRKAIHFATFAKCVLEYAEKHSDDDADSILEYINMALKYVDEGLSDENFALQTSNKWRLKELKSKLVTARKKYV